MENGESRKLANARFLRTFEANFARQPRSSGFPLDISVLSGFSETRKRKLRLLWHFEKTLERKKAGFAMKSRAQPMLPSYLKRLSKVSV